MDVLEEDFEEDVDERLVLEEVVGTWAEVAWRVSLESLGALVAFVLIGLGLGGLEKSISESLSEELLFDDEEGDADLVVRGVVFFLPEFTAEVSFLLSEEPVSEAEDEDADCDWAFFLDGLEEGAFVTESNLEAFALIFGGSSFWAGDVESESLSDVDEPEDEASAFADPKTPLDS